MHNILDIENYLYQIGLNKNTIRSYSYMIKIFLDSNPDAHKFKYKDILKYISGKISDYQNSDIKNVILSAIKKYYDFLIETGYRNDHPCKALILKRRKSTEIIYDDLFSSSELEIMLNREERYPILKLKNQSLISLLIFQGLTAREIVNLKVNNIDLDTGVIYVKSSPKTISRHLEMTLKQHDILERYIYSVRKDLITSKSDNLIISKSGNPITIEDVRYILSTFRPLFPNKNLCSQTIRMSVIYNWLNEKRIPLEQVQLMAGHKWISATARYRSVSVDEQRTIINMFHPLK